MSMYEGNCIEKLIAQVDRQLSLTPLELLALTNWEVKCEQRELGVVDSEKECD